MDGLVRGHDPKRNAVPLKDDAERVFELVSAMSNAPSFSFFTFFSTTPHCIGYFVNDGQVHARWVGPDGTLSKLGVVEDACFGVGIRDDVSTGAPRFVPNAMQLAVFSYEMVRDSEGGVAAVADISGAKRARVTHAGINLEGNTPVSVTIAGLARDGQAVTQTYKF